MLHNKDAGAILDSAESILSGCEGFERLVELFILKAVAQSGLQPCLGDSDLLPGEVASMSGVLPLLFAQARETAQAVGRAEWTAHLKVEIDEHAMLGRRLVCRDPLPEVARYPLVSLLLDAFNLAASLTRTPGRVDLNMIDPPVKPALFSALGVDSCPIYEEETVSPE